MPRRIVRKLLGLLLVAAIVTTCKPENGTTPVTEPPPTKVEPTKEPQVQAHLVAWPYDGAEGEIEFDVLDQCGVTYNIVEEDYWKRLQIMFSAGEQFDILYMNSTYLPSYAEGGLLDPVDDSAGIELDEFIEPLVQAFAFEDTAYGIPRDFDTLALFYNQDLFAELELEVPNDEWGWDELQEVAWFITDRTGVFGFSVPASDWVFSAFVLQAGSPIMSPDFSDTWIDSEEAVWAGEFYTGARWEGWGTIPEDVGASSQAEAFGRGDVAMMLDGSWRHSYLSEQYPDLNYGVVEPPAGPGGEGNLVFATAYAVSAKSYAPQAAWKAIACLTSEEAQTELLEAGVALPSRQYFAGHKLLGDNPVANVAFGHVEYATAYAWGPHHAEVAAAISAALLRVYHEEYSVEESLFQAAEEIRAIIWE